MRAGGLSFMISTRNRKIFENIAKEVDRRVPNRQKRMAPRNELFINDFGDPGLRPPIISAATAKKLNFGKIPRLSPSFPEKVWI